MLPSHQHRRRRSRWIARTLTTHWVSLPAAVGPLAVGTAAGRVDALVRADGAALLVMAVGSTAGDIASFQASRHRRRMFGITGRRSGRTARTPRRGFFAMDCSPFFCGRDAGRGIAPSPYSPFRRVRRARSSGVSGVTLIARFVRYFGLACLGIERGKCAMGFLRRNC